MVLEDLSKQGKIALLTLPRSDLIDQSKAQSSSTLSSPDGTANVHVQLVLIQLPTCWKPQQLKSSYFVSQGVGSSLSLVCESQRQSFSVHTAETSNVLVLVAPSEQHDSTANNGSASSKRRKVVTQDNSLKILQETPARLLRKSGASFLELRVQNLNRHALKEALTMFCAMQDTTATTGRSVTELSHLLQVSAGEVRQGLREIQAFCLQRDSYAMLSDQTLFECNQVVVTALGEHHIDYARSYSLNELVKFILEGMSDEERFDSDDRVIRFCLLQLSEQSGEFEEDWLEHHPLMDHDIRLSLAKVAACVARHLFLLQSNPWEETLFLSRWQGLVPGEGQVDTKMLRGLAISITKEEAITKMAETATDDEVFWKYMPAESLPQDACDGIKELFRHKPKWTRDELEPYVARYVNIESGGTTLDLLLRYTKVVNESVHSVPGSYFVYR